MKICHYASYDVNTGDNSTIYGIRKYFEKYSSIEKIEWIKKPNIEAQNFITSTLFICAYKKIFQSNVIKYFRHMEEVEGCDLMIIGGGGQIEDRAKWLTSNTLPFDKDILQQINVPIACIGLGINYFREPTSYKPKQLSIDAFKNLELLINKSVHFSLRNDGSYDILKKLFDKYEGSKEIFSKVKEIPDPGLFFEQELPKKTNKQIKKCIFQPAWNSSQRIITGRFGGASLKHFKEFFAKNNNFYFMPHTLKDYQFINMFDKNMSTAITKQDFKKHVKYDQYASFIKNFYFKYDMSIAMRGHGQLNAIAINMPSLYLSTQDKVKDFSLKNEFRDYNIDIQEEGCFEKLNHCTNRMLNDKNYLDEWYEIRDRKMLQFKKQFKDCVQEITQTIDANSKK